MCFVQLVLYILIFLIAYYNYSPKWRWIKWFDDICRVKYPPLFTDTEMNNCFSDTTPVDSQHQIVPFFLRSGAKLEHKIQTNAGSEENILFRVSVANQTCEKLFTGLVCTNIPYCLFSAITGIVLECSEFIASQYSILNQTLLLVH